MAQNGPEKSVSEAVRKNKDDCCTSEASASQSKTADITQNSTYTYVHSSTPLCEAEHTLTPNGLDEHLEPRHRCLVPPVQNPTLINF